jgi:cytochrome c oxidase cbb3-type subunit IV
MTYDALRHAADSWGLIFMGVLFVTFIGWTFRRGSRARHQNAANMIFEATSDEDRNNG